MRDSMKKRILSTLLATSFMISLFAPFTLVSARSFITNSSAVSGNDYTTNPLLADTITAIIKGDIDLYKDSACKNEVKLPIGSSLTSSGYYIKNKTTGGISLGWQCYVYGNAVYNRLFREVVHNGANLVNSEIIITGGKTTVSYSMFQSAGVKCGAYIRTTPNKNGSYTGSSGHSMIVLTYDQNHITYLEGNANGNGLARITKETWSEFNVGELTGRSRYLCHVVQPTAEKFDEFYPLASHDHTLTTKNETAHPHKEFQSCECGYKKYTGNTKTVNTCVDCFPPTSTNPDDYEYPARTLKYSATADLMTGFDVAWVQAVLYQLGYSITIDGKYGSSSNEVIKAFQSEYDLDVDGQCGPATRAKLLELWELSKHTHSFETKFDTAHPHKEYKHCACGVTEYTGNTKKVSTCAECYPAGTPVISLSSAKVTPNSKIEVSWNSTSNTKEYRVKYYDANRQIHQILSTTATSAQISFDKAGTYSIFVEAVGINGDTSQSNELVLEVRALSGAIGKCSWELKGSVLTVRGTGAMPGFDAGHPMPWDSNITAVIITDGITSIGSGAFSGCSNLATLSVSKSVTTIGANAFSSCNRLSEIWYEGTSSSKQSITIDSSNTALSSATWHYVDSPCDAFCNECTAKRTAPHHYDNQEDTLCNLCGYERVSYLTGDINNNKFIDMEDAIYLLFHINFPASYSVNQPVDFDGNGKQETEDAIYLLFHINFPASYPLS